MQRQELIRDQPLSMRPRHSETPGSQKVKVRWHTQMTSRSQRTTQRQMYPRVTHLKRSLWSWWCCGEWGEGWEWGGHRWYDNFSEISPFIAEMWAWWKISNVVVALLDVSRGEGKWLRGEWTGSGLR